MITTGYKGSELQGRVVIVGFESGDSDLHDSVIGKVRGAVLQAVYIESILENRIYVPFHWWAEFILGMILFAALVFPTWQWSSHLPLLALVVTFLLAVVLSGILVRLVVEHYVVYPSHVIALLPVLTLALMVINIERFVDKLAREKERTE